MSLYTFPYVITYSKRLLLMVIAGVRMISVEEIRRLRRNAGMSQADLAAEVGVSQSYIARMEGGTLDPKLSVVNAILEVVYGRRGRTCAEIMTPDPETVDARQTVAVAIAKMRAGDYSQLPVVRGLRVVGCITLADIVNNMDHDLTEMAVETIMDPRGVPVVNEETPINDVLPLFKSYQAVVVLRHGRVSGIITVYDLLKLLLPHSLM